MSTHLTQKNMTYVEHLCQAWGYSYHLIKGGILCFLHGIFPNLFVTSASDTVFYLHNIIHKTECTELPIEPIQLFEPIQLLKSTKPLKSAEPIEPL